MSDDLTKMFAAMMEQGQQMAKAMQVDPSKLPAMPSMADWMPTMPAPLMEAYMGKGLNPEGLDAKTRLLVTLSALTIYGAQAEDPVRLTLRHAMEAGATAQEIAETIVQVAPFAGAPAVTRAMELAKSEIEKKKGVPG
jgi:4-carboxymuconolactone decarboxylase